MKSVRLLPLFLPDTHTRPISERWYVDRRRSRVPPVRWLTVRGGGTRRLEPRKKIGDGIARWGPENQIQCQHREKSGPWTYFFNVCSSLAFVIRRIVLRRVPNAEGPTDN